MDTCTMKGKNLSKVSLIRIQVSFNCMEMRYICFELMWKYLSMTWHLSQMNILQ